MMECLYAPYLEIDPSLLDVSIMNTVKSLNEISLFNNDTQSNKIQIDVHIMETDTPAMVYNLNVPLSYTPADVTIEIIRKKLSSLGQTNEQMNDVIEKYKDSYMLNVCGCDEIFYGNTHKLSSYKVIYLSLFIILLSWIALFFYIKYIRKCISNCKKPNFHLISTDKVKSKSFKQEELCLNLINKCKLFFYFNLFVLI